MDIDASPRRRPLLKQMPKEISEIRGHRPRLQLVAGIVDAGFCDSFRKFLMSKSGGERRGKGKRNWRECVALSDKGSAV